MQKRSIETRTRIIKAAMKLFAQNGFEVTSVSEICEKAGLYENARLRNIARKEADALLKRKYREGWTLNG